MSLIRELRLSIWRFGTSEAQACMMFQDEVHRMSQ